MSYSEIYKKAFAELKKCYPAAFFTCAIGILLTSGLHQLKEYLYRTAAVCAGHNICLLLILLLVYLAASIGVYFWSDVIFAGEAKFFMQAKSGRINVRNLFWFVSGRGNAVKVLWRKYIHIVDFRKMQQTHKPKPVRFTAHFSSPSEHQAKKQE